jgi:hypothetical protein
MAGISLLRSQYSNLGNVAARFALAAHQVAHETDQNVVAGLSESRANGGQEEAAPQEPRPQPFDPRSPRDDRQSQQHERPSPAPATVAAREPGNAFHIDPHLPPPERMIATCLVVAQPLMFYERLRAAEQAYGASRDILQDAQSKPGHGFDAAS